MTDDLFDDFDLQPAASAKKADADVDNDMTEKNIEDPSKISSQDMHPDIFFVENMKNDGTSDGEISVVDEPENEEMSDDEMRHLAEQIENEKAASERKFSFRDEEEKKFEAPQFIQSESVVEVRTIDKIHRPNVQIDPEHFGETLRRCRESVCVSLADLSEELKIKESFLSALEREDYDELPPEVFIIAYIRKLGGIYHLTEEEIAALTQNVRDRMEIELPEDMDKVVSIYEHSEENDSKLRHIFAVFGVIFALAVILIGLGIYFFVSGSREKDNEVKLPRIKTEEHFSAESLLKLQPEVKLDAPLLKINK